MGKYNALEGGSAEPARSSHSIEGVSRTRGKHIYLKKGQNITKRFEGCCGNADGNYSRGEEIRLSRGRCSGSHRPISSKPAIGQY